MCLCRSVWELFRFSVRSDDYGKKEEDKTATECYQIGDFVAMFKDFSDAASYFFFYLLFF